MREFGNGNILKGDLIYSSIGLQHNVYIQTCKLFANIFVVRQDII